MQILIPGSAGEVGSALTTALNLDGHSVARVSSRIDPINRGFLNNEQASSLVLDGAISLVINASGPGDIREADGAWLARTRALASACSEAQIPSVLISTTRVMEGFEGEYQETDAPRPTSEYGRQNALSEAHWLENAGPNATVLRATNLFLSPVHASSPQTRLLPWSLLLEGLHNHRIVVRSSAKTQKQFVSARDMLDAIDIIRSSESKPKIVTTQPAQVFSLSEMAGLASSVLADADGRDIEVTFGDLESPSQVCLKGWLEGQGWFSKLDADQMRNVMSSWLAKHLSVK